MGPNAPKLNLTDSVQVGHKAIDPSVASIKKEAMKKRAKTSREGRHRWLFSMI